MSYYFNKYHLSNSVIIDIVGRAGLSIFRQARKVADKPAPTKSCPYQTNGVIAIINELHSTLS